MGSSPFPGIFTLKGFNSMKGNWSVYLLLFLFVLSNNLFSKIDVFTADNIVQVIKDKIQKTKTFTGSFVYSYNAKNYYGVIRFKSPGKFAMIYYGQNASGGSYETGQKFVCDGKRLWLYFKDQNIAINESLDRDKRTPMIGWNINRLLKEYVPTLPKTGYKVQYGKDVAYKIVCVPKSNTAGFRYINMIASEAGDILKMEAQNQLGVNIELAVKYDSFNNPIADDNFEFEPDENTQIYENILIPKGQNMNEAEPQQ
jgi:outer membrane lipoprotein-sorting protein